MTATAHSGPSNLLAMKVASQVREEEEKIRTRRKKSAVVLVHQFLLDAGYVESAACVERESGVSAAKHCAADNIDLLQIFQDHEAYFEIRFGHKPKYYRFASSGSTFEDCEGERTRPYRHAVPPAGVADRMRQRGPRPDGQSRPAPPAGGRGGGGEARRPRSSSDAPAAPEQQHNGTPASENGLDLCPIGGALPLGDRRRRGETGSGTKLRQQAEEKPKPRDDVGDGDNFAARQRLTRPLPTMHDWSADLRDLSLTIQRDIVDADPNVHWGDIVALEGAKQLLKEAVVMPIKYPQFFTGRLKPWRGILLFGPPGTGKTMLAKAVATECNTTFFNISASTIVSKWRGDSEKLVRVLFDLARYYAPSTVFLDELDSIMSQRAGGGQEHEGSRRMKTELLIQMDGINREGPDSPPIFVLAASNIPWDLDAAVLRRLEKRILVGLPTAAARRKMFQTNLDGHCVEDALDWGKLAAQSEGYSGSDINVVCREAMMRTVRAKMVKLEQCSSDAELQQELLRLDDVVMSDLEHALAVTKASGGPVPQARYAQWDAGHGSGSSQHVEVAAAEAPS
eukprot:TRINITY_DN9531_c0_g1_i1.p1 TRINITY_DN9531_c0_g1~~TRINITY_DN9531_c0_g1_i1.p1  ORF type:complete len:607 (+),score=198.89 TRINITY_DN9531_c0_g1_i1:123-1823(+)